MKFIEIEKLTERIPNKYMAIVLASKEARRITEANKPVEVPSSDILPETAVPEIKTKEAVAVKKRGRKSKKATLETPQEINIATMQSETSPGQDLITMEMTADKKIKSVAAEKSGENPYIAALKKVVKYYDLTGQKKESDSE